MSVPARVVSPLRKLFERDGVEVVLVSVELWPDEVVVRLRGLPSTLTEALEAGFEEQLEEWGRRKRAGAGGPPPPQPAERVFDLEIALSDETGTRFAPRSSARGGSGTMFRADWVFAPGVPDASSWLELQVGHGGSEPERVRLELDA